MPRASSIGTPHGPSYECVRCGARTTGEELLRLPRIRCICGYRVFRKSRMDIGREWKTT